MPSGRWAVVVSRYNQSITSKLLDGALETLASHKVPADQVDVAWVPGAWEIPLAAKCLVENGRFLAVMCLGAVIRGETTHDQHINRTVSGELGRLATDSGVPVLFGVLTCETLEQAIQRAGGNQGNKGAECAEAALRMVSLLQKLPGPTRA
ncbi:MAG: 6,7-dimethyl-8-ribityllumazine synthase [Pirellulales bacterium]